MTTFIHRTVAGVSALTLVGTLAAAVPTLAQTTTAGGRTACTHRRTVAGLYGPMRLRAMAQQLGLSVAQKEQLRAVVQSHKNDWQALRKRAMEARQSLRQAITANAVDDAAIRRQSAQLASVQADIAVARAHVRAEMLKVLTPEQRAKAETLRAARRQHLT